MTDHPTPTETTARTSGGRGRAANIALWVLQVLLAALFAFAGITKLVGVLGAPEGFAEIGFPQWFRYLIGALELAGAIGLLIPRLTALAALGLVGIMVGAIFTHVFAVPPPWTAVFPATFGILLALIAWARWPRGGSGTAGAPAAART